jgi:hypothetical protein
VLLSRSASAARERVFGAPQKISKKFAGLYESPGAGGPNREVGEGVFRFVTMAGELNQESEISFTA